MPQRDKIFIIGGGTVSHVRSHLAICAPAYGETARQLHKSFIEEGLKSIPVLTRMAGGSDHIETNEDVRRYAHHIIKRKSTRCIIFNPALVDYDGTIGDIPSGKYSERLRTREQGSILMKMTAADKIVGDLKAMNPEVIIVSFKTTCGVTPEEQEHIVRQAKINNNADLVIGNDTKTRRNVIIRADNTYRDCGEWRTLALYELVKAIKNSN